MNNPPKREKIAFALEVLEDGLEDAKMIARAKGQEEGTFTADEWEEVRSTLEFAIKILKGEEVRGG